MNFMAGRYEETGSRSSSSSSSSAAFQQHRSGYGGGGEEERETVGTGVVEREHMFDKVVTPSDVGKLNRLVIPKQHAEKYFPLDAGANEKGLLLNFEDRNGKPWRFRYSYWNSSQSYVMTKGWSRFVKEKKLDAGDIVSFQRGALDSDKDRLFIDWRRRPDAPPDPFSFRPHHHHHHQPPNPWGPLFMHHHPPSPYHHPYGGAGASPYSTIVNGNPCPPGSIVYLRSNLPTPGGGSRGVLAPGPQQMPAHHLPMMSSAGSGGYMDQQHQQQQQMTMMMNRDHQVVEAGEEEEVFESVPVVQGNKAAPKRLRLFGVNMDCPISPPHHHHHHHHHQDHTTTTDILMTSSALLPHHQQHPSSSPSSSSLARLRHSSDDDKGKGSMSLDLDI